MRIALVSRNPHKLKKHLKTIRKYRQYISEKPQVVVAVGGDGTFLAAERLFPGIPKLLVREQSICNKCDWDNLDEGLKRIIKKNFYTKDISKLKARVGKHILEAVNDIVIRNVHPTHAIRFTITVDKRKINEEFIGDGVVVSTVFGSEGYFRSITKRHFEKGIGIAFNNTTKNQQPLLIDSNATIGIELTRGFAHVAADNNPDFLTVLKGQKIVIKQSNNFACLVRFS